MADNIEPQTCLASNGTGPGGEVRWGDLRAGERAALTAGYFVAFLGPAYYVVTLVEVEWYFYTGLFVPLAILELVVPRFWPRIRGLVPGGLLVWVGLFVGCVAAMVGGMLLLGTDRHEIGPQVAVAVVAASLATWFTCFAYRVAKPKPRRP